MKSILTCLSLGFIIGVTLMALCAYHIVNIMTIFIVGAVSVIIVSYVLYDKVLKITSPKINSTTKFSLIVFFVALLLTIILSAIAGLTKSIAVTVLSFITGWSALVVVLYHAITLIRNEIDKSIKRMSKMMK